MQKLRRAVCGDDFVYNERTSTFQAMISNFTYQEVTLRRE